MKQTHDDALGIGPPELFDVWVGVIGSKLDAVDIVMLSMVSKWCHHIAHNITTHQGKHIKVPSDLFICSQVSKHWPHLKLELKLEYWKQDTPLHSTTTTATTTTTTQTHHRSSSVSSSSSSLSPVLSPSSPVLSPPSSPPSSPPPTQPLSASRSSCSVSSLFLERCRISSFDFVNSAKLEKFVLYDPQMDEAARGSLERLLTSCPSLVSLEISHCLGWSDDVTWLATSLNQLSNISRLSLFANCLGVKRMRQIVPSLSLMTHVTCLDLSSNSLRSEGMRCLAPALGHMTHTTDLNLSYNNLGEDGAKHLAHSLARMPQMKKLKLACNWMGSDGVKLLLGPLTKMRLLSSLNLRDNNHGYPRSELDKLLPSLKFLAM
eukprot:c10818_g1_i1.p1 GENE.c10818_g1_i1~~c10818_g1_i1.p1  ORF type:complete len:376 (+),score=89.86 c10818_g1_i1:114-1241(+)